MSGAQQLLVSMGSEGLTQSGIFDGLMLHAVKLFQQQHTYERGQPLKPDGEVGPRTWWSLHNSAGKA